MHAKLWEFLVDSGHGLVILGRRDRQGCPADGLVQNLLHQIVEMFQEKWKLWFLGTSCGHFLVSLRLEDLGIQLSLIVILLLVHLSRISMDIRQSCHGLEVCHGLRPHSFWL